MSADPAFIADRLAWQFRRSGGDGELTRPFVALSCDLQARLLAGVELHPGEVVAIACYFDDQKWALLTTKRLIWRDANGAHQLATEEIAEIPIEPAALWEAGRTRKLGIKRLTVVSRTGERHRIELEPGRPYFGFLNAPRLA